MNCLEVDEDILICFMKKDVFYVEGVKGWNLMSYKGYVFGWIKYLGNCINNYLFNEFKILN